jgi:hypothetical protein
MKIQLKDVRPGENFWLTPGYAEQGHVDDAYQLTCHNGSPTTLEVTRIGGGRWDHPLDMDVWVNRIPKEAGPATNQVKPETLKFEMPSGICMMVGENVAVGGLRFLTMDKDGWSAGSFTLTREEEAKLLALLRSREVPQPSVQRKPRHPERELTARQHLMEILGDAMETGFDYIKGEVESLLDEMLENAKPKPEPDVAGQEGKPRTEAEIQFEIMSLTVDLLALKSGQTREEVLEHCIGVSSKQRQIEEYERKLREARPGEKPIDWGADHDERDWELHPENDPHAPEYSDKAQAPLMKAMRDVIGPLLEESGRRAYPQDRDGVAREYARLKRISWWNAVRSIPADEGFGHWFRTRYKVI